MFHDILTLKSFFFLNSTFQEKKIEIEHTQEKKRKEEEA